MLSYHLTDGLKGQAFRNTVCHLRHSDLLRAATMSKDFPHGDEDYNSSLTFKEYRHNLLAGLPEQNLLSELMCSAFCSHSFES